jgi:hypothetical protein
MVPMAVIHYLLDGPRHMVVVVEQEQDLVEMGWPAGQVAVAKKTVVVEPAF